MRNSFDQSAYLQRLAQQEEEQRYRYGGAPEEQEKVTTGNAAWDFFGQMLWGGAESLTWSGLAAADVFGEAQAERRGEEYTSWQETLSGVDADWDELTGWGKAGYSVGTAVGMIPSFGVGKTVGVGAVKSLEKLVAQKAFGSGAPKMVAKKSAKELTEKVGEIGLKKNGTQVVETLDLDANTTKEIIEEGYATLQAAKAAKLYADDALKEVYEANMASSLKGKISSIAKLPDDQASELSKEVIKIVTRNNPDDAMTMIQMYAQNTPGLKRLIGGESTSRIVSAMGYDAAIGIGMGFQKVAADEIYKQLWGVERNEDTHQFDYTNNYDFDMNETGMNFLKEAGTSAWHFALIGPVKFIKGGTAGQHRQRLTQIIGQNFKSVKPVNNMNNESLRAQITAIDQISGGWLHKTFSRTNNKYPKNARWWETKTGEFGPDGKEIFSSKDNELLRNFLKDLRSDFLKKAPMAWVKEFKTDVFRSLPRMSAGVVAMNTPGMIDSFYNLGFTRQALNSAFGESPQEVVANVMTAAWFTRRPHSFNTEATGPMFKSMIETGTIDAYINAKHSKLRKVMGGLQTYGKNNEALWGAIRQYGDPTSNQNVAKTIQSNADTAIKKYFDTTAEFETIRKAFENIPKNEAGGVDIETAYKKKINEMLRNGDISIEEAQRYRDNLSVSSEILKLYRENSGESLASDLFTPESAFTVINNIAGMQFNGKLLTARNIGPELDVYRETSIAKATLPHTNILKQFVIDTYEALGLGDRIEIEPNTGALKIPEIIGKGIIKFPSTDMETSLATVIEGGRKNGWIQSKLGRTPSQSELFYDQKILNKTTEVYNEAVDRMMSSVWGQNWKEQKIERDILILENPVWEITYNDFIQNRRRSNAYQILTGGKNHTLNPTEANQAIDVLNQLLRYKNRREVAKQGENEKYKPTYEHGEVEQFINRLHKNIKLLNPGISAVKNVPLTFTEAHNLMEMISGKNKRGGLLGDIFTSTQEAMNFEAYVLRKAIHRLTAMDHKINVDIAASLLQLIENPVFDFSKEGKDIVLPDLARVKNALNADKSISPETTQELITFYTDITQAVKDSNFPVRFEPSVGERSKGDFAQSLIAARAVGRNQMERLSLDTSEQLKSALENQSTKLSDQVLWLDVGLDATDTKIRRQYELELRELTQARESTEQLIKYINDGLTLKNPYTLSAISSRRGDINNAIQMLNSGPIQSTRAKYATELLRIQREIDAQRSREALNEMTLNDLMKEQIASYKIGDKDVQEKSLRITVEQFQIKYEVKGADLNRIFEFDQVGQRSKKDTESFVRDLLREFYDSPAEVLNKDNIATINKIKNNILNSPDMLSFDPNTSEGKVNFTNFIVEPIKAMQKEGIELLKEKAAADPKIKIPTEAEQFTDLYTVTSNYFSKKVIKTLKIDARSGVNRLIQSEKKIGDKATGFGGILKYLDPFQQYIYMAETSASDFKGRLIRNILGDSLDKLNAELSSGNYTIHHVSGKQHFYNYSDLTTMKSVNRQPGITGQRFTIVPINESTPLIIRVDRTGKGESIHSEIKSQFRPSDKKTGDKGGELFQILEAIYDGDIYKQNSPKHEAIRNLLRQVQDSKTAEDAATAVKLTRLLLNMPDFVEKAVRNNTLDLDIAEIKNRQKRDKLAETKNGFIPTKENLIRAASMYKDSGSLLHETAYKNIKKWIEPQANGKYRKMKVVSIDDEGKTYSPDGRELTNVFDAMKRHEIELESRLAKGEITPNEFNMNKEMFSKAYKSIADGEFFVSKDLYLASISLIGLHPDHVQTSKYKLPDGSTGMSINGFHSGGVKPTIAHSKVNLETGRVEVFFGKTALKYNPLMDNLLNNLGVDAITFKSANKINSLKKGFNEDFSQPYSEVKGLEPKDPKLLNLDWTSYVKGKDNFREFQTIEVPLEAIALRTISKGQHDPLVGQNAGVHMSADNGIVEWIGLDAKLNTYYTNLAGMQKDPMHRTALAQRVLGKRAEEGDPSVVNSAISSILNSNGMILEPWAKAQMEQNLVGYYLNNGAIAGGKVKEGSLDIMSMDMGYLKPTIRSNRSDHALGVTEIQNSVKFFGEFIQSYHASTKDFVKMGQQGNGVHSVLIQKLKYMSERELRDKETNKLQASEADGFLVQVGNEVFLQIEGRYMDNAGYIRDINSSKSLPISSEAIAFNKNVFAKALETQNLIYKQISPNASIGDVMHLIKNGSHLKTGMWGPTISIGALNSRQPRNMMGDIVISRLAFNRDGSAYVNRKAGNVSRMNYLDAIKPQDADYDFDKSFNYNAAPGKFWREANKLAGYITTGKEASREIDRIFDVNQNDTFSKYVADKAGPDHSYEKNQNIIDNAKGTFIKMHQTATYLVNMFRNDPLIANIEYSTARNARATFRVVLSEQGKQITTVDNISKMATKFIDIYKNLPSDKEYQQNRQKIQNDIWFGENGLFEIESFDPTKRSGSQYQKQPSLRLSDSEFVDVTNFMNRRIIMPVNEYLQLNKGSMTDPAGMRSKALLGDYSRAYEKLLMDLDPLSNQWKKGMILQTPGLNTAANFLATSKLPFDFAMREMHKIHRDVVELQQRDKIGKGASEAQEFINYIEGGLDAIKRPNESRDAAYNRMFNKALQEYVLEEGKIIRLTDLDYQIKSVTYEIERRKPYEGKNPQQKTLDLEAKKTRLTDMREMLLESISYKFDNKFIPGKSEFSNEVALNKVVKTNIERNKETYYATKNSVVVDKSGKIKEVILKNRVNRQKIFKSDKIIENGRRFAMDNASMQTDLAILYQAYSGNARIKLGKGKSAKWEYIDTYESNKYINQLYVDLQRELIKLHQNSNKDNRRKNIYDIIDYSAEQKQLIYDHLFNMDLNPATQKALMLRMLTPNISDKVVSVRSTTGLSQGVQYDYMYMQNMMSKPLMTILSEIVSGKKKGGNKEFAEEFINDLNVLKNAAFLQSKDPNLDFELSKVKMYTEAASLDGFLTSEKILNPEVFQKSRSEDVVMKRAAKLMIDYAQGKGLVDPVLLYKASIRLREAGIPVDQQWGRMKHLVNEDGTLRNYGHDKIFISEKDALKRANELGEKGGKEQSTTEFLEETIGCYK